MHNLILRKEKCNAFYNIAENLFVAILMNWITNAAERKSIPLNRKTMLRGHNRIIMKEKDMIQS